MKNKIVIAAILVAIVFGGGGFFAGLKYDQGKTSQGANTARIFNAGQNGPGAGRVRGAGNGFINGAIIAKDDKSLTIKMQDGSSKIIFYSGSTNIVKSTAGSTDDLQINQNVMVNGTTNSDGSLTAQQIQLRPAPLPTTAPQNK